MGGGGGGGGGKWVWTPAGKSQVDIGSHRNFVLPPLEEQLDPLSPITSLGTSAQPSVIYVDDEKKYCHGLPDRIIWVRAWKDFERR